MTKDKLITDEITQAISLLDGVLYRLQAMTQPAPVEEPAAEPSAIDKFLEPAKSKPVTLEDVRAALTTLAGIKGAASPKKLLAAHNAKKLSELDAFHFPAVFKAANAEASAND